MTTDDLISVTEWTVHYYEPCAGREQPSDDKLSSMRVLALDELTARAVFAAAYDGAVAVRFTSGDLLWIARATAFGLLGYKGTGVLAPDLVLVGPTSLRDCVDLLAERVSSQVAKSCRVIPIDPQPTWDDLPPG